MDKMATKRVVLGEFERLSVQRHLRLPDTVGHTAAHGTEIVVVLFIVFTILIITVNSNWLPYIYNKLLYIQNAINHFNFPENVTLFNRFN